MKSLSQSVYSQLSETAETQFAKTVSELQSEVRTKHTCLKTREKPEVRETKCDLQLFIILQNERHF